LRWSGATVEDAVAALKEFEGDLETLTHIFLVDEKERAATEWCRW
jgi:Mg/Co/Ni transporter MgtE